MKFYKSQDSAPQLFAILHVEMSARLDNVDDMKFAMTKRLMLAAATLLAHALISHASDLAVNDIPYSPIVARNIFGLLPIPTNNPDAANAQPTTPPPKITPNGLMSLFGVPQALFKVSYPPAGGQPAHDQSYMLAQGESEDNIEITKIDMGNAIVTFNNNGTVQELPLAAAPKITGPAAPVGNPGGGIGGGPSVGQGMAAGGIPRPIVGGGPRGPRGVANPGDEAQADNSGASGVGGQGNADKQVFNPASQEGGGLSPEAQALLIEQNYMQAKASGSKNANLFPPTPLRGQSDAALNGEAAPNP